MSTTDAGAGELLQSYGEGRCEICGWPLAKTEDRGCVPGNCSYRTHDDAEWTRLDKRRQALAEGRIVPAPIPPKPEDGLAAELAKLSAKATQGRWHLNSSRSIAPEDNKSLDARIAHWLGNYRDWRANATFIVALVNAYRSGRLLPTPQARADAGEQEDNNPVYMREQLGKLLQHPTICLCGLSGEFTVLDGKNHCELCEKGCVLAGADAGRDGSDLKVIAGHLRALIAYAKWQIEEGPGHHPTLPSAIAAANGALCRVDLAGAVPAMLAALPKPPAADRRDAVAQAIRSALVENWSDAANARKWDEDVLLTGCRKVGNGKGYEKPETAAQLLALEAADAAILAQPATNGEGLSRAARDVLAERRRQVEEEGWTVEHDDAHNKGQMARAAGNYIAAACITLVLDARSYDHTPPLDHISGALGWPWARYWWKPGLVRRMLVKAGALILAEIERLDRASAPKAGTTEGRR